MNATSTPEFRFTNYRNLHACCALLTISFRYPDSRNEETYQIVL